MKKIKALQLSKNNSKHDTKLTSEQAVEFLENFRLLAAQSRPLQKSKLISIKIPPALLTAFKAEAKKLGKPYQSIIKELMWEWLDNRV
jgi:predicted DNA binding CopG/RHH family protein